MRRSAPAALPWLLLPILIGAAAAVAAAKPLSSLLLGETYARSLGVKVTSLRHAVLAATVLLVAPVRGLLRPGQLRRPHCAPLRPGAGRKRRGSFRSYRSPRSAAPCWPLAGDAIVHAPWEQHFLHLNAILAIVGAPVVILILIFSPAVRQWR